MIRIFYVDKETGNGNDLELELDIPIVNRAGDWVLHRNVAWHTGKTWFTGHLDTIPLSVQPKQHNRKCKEFYDLQYKNTQEDYKTPPTDKNLHSEFYKTRDQALTDCINTFKPVDIEYSVTLLQIGLRWPFKQTLESKTEGLRAVLALDRIIPKSLVSELVPIWWKENKFPRNIQKVLAAISKCVDNHAFNKITNSDQEDNLRYLLLQECEVTKNANL